MRTWYISVLLLNVFRYLDGHVPQAAEGVIIIIIIKGIYIAQVRKGHKCAIDIKLPCLHAEAPNVIGLVVEEHRTPRRSQSASQ